MALLLHLLRTGVASLVLLLLPGVATAAPVGTPVLGYVDPGSGSFVLQALAASLAGAMVVASNYWQRIKGWFGRGAEPADSEGTAPRDDE